jgi:hypothetical protein
MYNNAYDYSNQELLEEYEKEIAKLAVQNSGLVIDLAPSGNLDALYLRGILLSRMDKSQDMPFNRGDILRIDPQLRILVSAINLNRRGLNYYFRGDIVGETFKVTRVYYLGNMKWGVSLEEHGHNLFPAERFLKNQPAEQSAVA